MTFSTEHAPRIDTIVLSAAIVVLVGCQTAEDRPAVDPSRDYTIATLSHAMPNRSKGTSTREAKDNSTTLTPTETELAELRAGLIIPIQGVSASELPDTFNEMRGNRRHEALDIIAARGTPVLSAAEGRLLKLFTSKNGGLMVYAADWTDRFILMYGHLDCYADGLTEGMSLQRGQILGYVGTTGNAPSNVPHLHFAIARAGDIHQWWRGAPVDPRPLLVP